MSKLLLVSSTCLGYLNSVITKRIFYVYHHNAQGEKASKEYARFLLLKGDQWHQAQVLALVTWTL
jgi:hypothetical protein